ncbi:TolC family protein [Alcanivorax sp. 1008]|uniref:TolC family protein n=1 Tax=Alcanivorax sp. 1008 TaxID=2816853 RepID=UPI001D9C94F3|nr:TolC family protein [Alcanivorax sp. 1008]MCC1498135.1 TolC family protein [Alcanivorax sp. 1008]
MNLSSRTGRLTLVLLTLVITGCAVNPPQHGEQQAHDLLAQRGLTVSQTASEFRGELSRQQAVQATLLNHPAMRAEYARLEIASADVVRASELVNPSLSLSWLDVSSGGSEFSIGLSQSLAGVMLRPARRRMAEAEYELAVLTLAESLQSLALESEAAWYAVAAAEQRLQLQRWASNTALWADQLGERFAAAGNITPLERAQLARRGAEAELAMLQAERERDQARSELAVWLALAHDDWQVSAALPLPVSHHADADAIIADVLEHHPALQQIRQRKSGLQQQLGGEQRQRWLDDAEVGIEHDRSGDERATGPTLGFRLPLWHRSRGTLQALAAQQELLDAEEAMLRQQLPVKIRTQLNRLQQLHAAITSRQQRLLPALAAEVDARQKRVNFMLDGVFDLLESKADELDGWIDQVNSLANYWQQQVELARLLGQATTSHGGDSFDITAVAPANPASIPVQDDPHRGHH